MATGMQAMDGNRNVAMDGNHCWNAGNGWQPGMHGQWNVATGMRAMAMAGNGWNEGNGWQRVMGANWNAGNGWQLECGQ